MLDYKEINLKIGLEIHQQLDTNKLFCECPSELRTDNPNVFVKRKLNAVAGERGKVDIAAIHEATKNKEFIYEGYSDTTCQVEFDSEPPREINKEALKIVLQIAILFNAKPIGVCQVMRKTVIDGSNTAGFQRTLLIAKDGYIKFKNKKIGIASICLEEDAARIIKQDLKSVTYRLDRLGIPLIEITTNPDIKTPQEAKEVALKIGEILHSCKVKRGIGTIRQDVNLSIKGGVRTEIKGVQEPDLISKVIENEIKRQQDFIKNKINLEPTVRNAQDDGSTKFLRPMPGAERMYPETDLALIKIVDILKEAKATLPRLIQDIIEELQKKGINKEIATLIAKEKKIDLFNQLSKIASGKADLIAKLLTLIPKEIASHEKISLNKIEAVLTKENLTKILNACKQKKIAESSIRAIIREMVKGVEVNKVISKFKLLTKKELEKKIKEIVKEKKDIPFGALMGIAMSELKGKAEGKEIADLLKKFSK